MTFDRRSFLLGSAATLGLSSLGCRAPRPAPPRSRRVVIVGAGLSGLAVAHELVKRGLEVLVLEATRVPGGRIRTIRSFRDGLFAEAGATHVVGDPDLMALIEDCGVEQTSYKKQKLARIRVRRGERQVFAPGTPMPEDQSLSAEEQSLGEDGRWQRYLALVEQIDPRSHAWSGELASIDRVTGGDWLRAMGASPGFIAGIDGMVPVGDGIESISALSLVRDLASMRAEMRGLGAQTLGRIAGGTDHLPRAIAGRLGDRVVYGTDVLKIEHDRDGAIVVAADRTGTQRIAAARVVLTMPFPVLRRLVVAPGWSPAKQRAISALGMTSVTRIWVESNRRFWNERGESGTAETDLEIGRVRDESEGQPARGGLLGAYLTGRAARRWGALDRARLLETAVDELERVHPGTREHHVGGDCVVWDRERFAAGAYPCFAPGHLTEHAAAAAAPEGVIHFAGDGTSHRPGFMHGAVASAKRVVAEILEAAPRPTTT